MSDPDDQITRILVAMNHGDQAAADMLLPLVYQELHRLASTYMRRERKDHTLQPTALINEAYLRLAHEDIGWQNREHFIGVAANVMRRVLVDHARARNAAIRGGDLVKVPLEDNLAISPEGLDELLVLNEALTRLEQLNPRQARVVELRYFGGLSVEQVAAILGLTPRSIKRDWAMARIWLFNEIKGTKE
jgi:RNA polymerase sigma-70 factor (ECF subfamily)